LLYSTEKFQVVSSAPLRPKFDNNDLTTRDILYVNGILGKDTLHLFVNHWPSRRGGQEKSEWKRIAVAELLKHSADSILALDTNANIIIMGDFNDESSNKSIRLLTDPVLGGNLVSLKPEAKEPLGSLKYKGQWFLYDQFIVSASLIKQQKAGHMSVSDSPFLFSDDEKNVGVKPFRTYAGPHYLGGYSDHLPVFIQLNTQTK